MTSTSKINPFDLDWLSKNFALDITLVESAQWSENSFLYEIKFKKLSDAVYFAEITKECYTQLWDFNKTVSLNKYTKDRILEAAKIRSHPDFMAKNKLKLEAAKEKSLEVDCKVGYHSLENNLKNIERHITTAINSDNNKDYITHWIYAFGIAATNAIHMYKDDEEERKLEYNGIRYGYDFPEAREIIQYFISCVKKHLTKINNIFTSHTDWEDFYTFFKPLKRCDIDAFLSFIHTIQDKDIYVGEYNYISNAVLDKKSNPYILKQTSSK